MIIFILGWTIALTYMISERQTTEWSVVLDQENYMPENHYKSKASIIQHWINFANQQNHILTFSTHILIFFSLMKCELHVTESPFTLSGETIPRKLAEECKSLLLTIQLFFLFVNDSAVYTLFHAMKLALHFFHLLLNPTC